MTSYENSLEHLIEELHRIDLLVSLHCERCKEKYSGDDFQGLYISENEVNALLQIPPDRPKAEVSQDPQLQKIEALALDIKNKKIESIKQKKELRLHVLSELFHLEPFEIDTLLICLAPELDLRYEKLYSYLQNDVTRKRPTVDLMMRLLCYL